MLGSVLDLDQLQHSVFLSLTESVTSRMDVILFVFVVWLFRWIFGCLFFVFHVCFSALSEIIFIGNVLV